MSEVTVVTASVCRPTLARACESVQEQTLPPEVHCILLQQIMRAPLGLKPPSRVPVNISWMPPPQPNIVEAYNMADALASTELIAMLDDDCWWEPHHLESLVKLLRDTDSDFVWSSSIIHDEDDDMNVIAVRVDDRPMFQKIDTNEILFKRSCIERWGGFDVSDADPQELPKLRGIDGRRIERWVRLGAKYAHSSEPTCHYTYREAPEF